MGHASREVLRKVVDIGSADMSTRHGGCVGRVRRVWSDKVLGKMVKDRGQAIVFVESGQRTSSQLPKSASHQKGRTGQIYLELAF